MLLAISLKPYQVKTWTGLDFVAGRMDGWVDQKMVQLALNWLLSGGLCFQSHLD